MLVLGQAGLLANDLLVELADLKIGAGDFRDQRKITSPIIGLGSLVFGLLGANPLASLAHRSISQLSPDRFTRGRAFCCPESR